MELSDFELERAAFEFRYESGYLHWDRSGAMWMDAAQKWPGLKIVKGEPAATSFVLENRHELMACLDRAHVSSHYPKLEQFIELSDGFTKIVTRHLEIRNYTRLGCRLVYFQRLPNKEDMAKFILATRHYAIPEGRHFEVDPVETYPDYAVRMEGKTKGVVLRLRAETRRIDFDPPINLRQLQRVHDEICGIVFDIDNYTVGNVTVGQFKAQEWINHIIHLVRRDSAAFLKDE